LYFVSQTDDGEYVCGGHSFSNTSGDKSENSIGDADYWIIKLTDKYNSFTGKLFIDANSNQIQDIGEIACANKTVAEINTGRFAFSNQNGYYNVAVFDSGTFTVYPQSISYYNAVPANHTAYFTDINQTDSLNDFAYQPAGIYNDLCVQVTPLGRFRPGFNALYEITYENVGTTALNPSVIFFPDSTLSFISSAPAAGIVSADSVVWNFGPLAPFQKGSIRVTVNVDASTPIGAKINSAVRIEPIANDANLYCNYAIWEVIATGSFDPNEILVDRDTVYATELSNPPALEYIINFQNTGNDTAFTVKVLTPIDTAKLGLSSFEYVASSNPVNIRYIPWENNLEFRFDNILLADSGTNEPGSQGFVRYRIKPKKTLTSGDSIKNTAYIYFDFNEPVKTNTAITEIVLPTGVQNAPTEASQLTVYPNPSSNNITVLFSRPASHQATLHVLDLFWKTRVAGSTKCRSIKNRSRCKLFC
jgi:hypothetical protein